MIAGLSWLPLPLHASLDDWHGWAYQIAAIAIVGGIWVLLTGVAERWGGHGRGGDGRAVRAGVGLTRDGAVGAARGSEPRATGARVGGTGVERPSGQEGAREAPAQPGASGDPHR